MNGAVAGPLHLRARLRRARRGPLLALLLIVLAGAVVAHHLPMDMHGMGQTAEICLAVTTGAVLVVAAAAAILPPRRPHREAALDPRGGSAVRLRVGRARAGPRYLHLVVLRR